MPAKMRKGPLSKITRKKINHGQRYYVYALVDPRDGNWFYVGKGVKNRAYDHITEARRGGTAKSNRRKLARILEIEADGLQVAVQKVCEGLTESEAFSLEYSYLRQYGDKLVNGRDRTCSVMEREASFMLWELNQTPRPKDWAFQYVMKNRDLPSKQAYREYKKVYGLLASHVSGLLVGVLEQRRKDRNQTGIAQV